MKSASDKKHETVCRDVRSDEDHYHCRGNWSPTSCTGYKGGRIAECGAACAGDKAKLEIGIPKLG